MRYRIRRRLPGSTEIDITAFMNLMVILVPFLLITAVFSRITVLQLNLPPGGGADQARKQELNLEVVIRRDRLVVRDRDSGPLKTIPNTGQGYDHRSLGEFLKQVKARFPDKQSATVLSEPDTPYEVLVAVMDTVRVAQVVQGASVVRAELFPEIAIGDAPVEGPPAGETTATGGKAP
ncbi:MAG TPA: biopolymer transporter ExbD [Thiotrichales bacterium]|nr:biopolymer transporter ExbD [Thiotrichales bacterium]